MSASALRIKRQHGRFYTEGNPFVLNPFKKWAQDKNLTHLKVLEPFAGKNNLIHALREVGLANRFKSFDIEPGTSDVVRRDTLENFPSGFSFCVTNPPWLAKNSAKRRGLDFPNTSHDDLYKHALHLCLKNCECVAAIIPATFLQSGLFRERLDAVVFLHDQSMFADTDNPVCLALFSPRANRVEIYNDDEFLGFLDDLEKYLPEKSRRMSITFNHPEGSLGFIAFDDTRAPSIRFVPGEQLTDYTVGFSSRMITRIKCNVADTTTLIHDLNKDISSFREKTQDVFLTPFKGLRKDGRYRRRMNYELARDFIFKHANPNARF